MSDVQTVPVVEDQTLPTTDTGDHDRFAHYVVQEDLDRSKAEGTPIRALCGKIWTPDRNPKDYPICPSCKEIADRWNARGDN